MDIYSKDKQYRLHIELANDEAIAPKLSEYSDISGIAFLSGNHDNIIEQDTFNRLFDLTKTGNVVALPIYNKGDRYIITEKAGYDLVGVGFNIKNDDLDDVNQSWIDNSEQDIIDAINEYVKYQQDYWFVELAELNEDTEDYEVIDSNYGYAYDDIKEVMGLEYNFTDHELRGVKEIMPTVDVE